MVRLQPSELLRTSFKRESGTARPVGRRWTVAGWLEHWIGNIACPPHIAENTHVGYRVEVVNHLAILETWYMASGMPGVWTWRDF